MKIPILTATSLVMLLIAGCASDPAGNQARLQAQARISKSEAETIALAKTPNGTIKEAELEKEHGKLIWSFDIATPDSRNITEVNVNAMTGEAASVEQETPGQQAAEKD